MPPLEIGIVSDEVSAIFREAVGHAKSWGVSLFELRCLRTGRVPNVTQSELREVQDIVESENLKITALSPGIFKHFISQEDETEHELDTVLPATITLAKELGTPLIIVFGFIREPNEPAGNFGKAVEYMSKAVHIAEQHDVRIAIENEPGFWCDTGSATARFVKRVGSKALGVNWDPANAVGTGERPFPEGYRAVKDFVFNIHVKDTRENALVKCVPVGEGVVNWREQLRALSEDTALRHVTIETHCTPLVEKSRQNVETVRNYLREFNRDD